MRFSSDYAHAHTSVRDSDITNIELCELWTAAKAIPKADTTRLSSRFVIERDLRRERKSNRSWRWYKGSDSVVVTSWSTAMCYVLTATCKYCHFESNSSNGMACIVWIRREQSGMTTVATPTWNHFQQRSPVMGSSSVAKQIRGACAASIHWACSAKH